MSVLNMVKLDWEGYEQRIPVTTQAELNRYVTQGLIPGAFVKAVLCNDLVNAVQYASDANLKALPSIVEFMFNRMPAVAWGNEDKIWAFVENPFYENLAKAQA